MSACNGIELNADTRVGETSTQGDRRRGAADPTGRADVARGSGSAEYAMHAILAGSAEYFGDGIVVERNAVLRTAKINGVDGVGSVRCRVVPEADTVAARAEAETRAAVTDDLELRRQVVRAPPIAELDRREVLDEDHDF